MSSIEIIPAPSALARSAAVNQAILAWADSTTGGASPRRRDLLRDKARAVSEFFDFAGKPPDQIAPADVKAWQFHLERQGLASSTVYGLISRISSFYRWAMQDEQFAAFMPANPVRLARPKAPKAYQTDSTQALDNEAVRALLAAVKARANAGELVGQRDYAMLLFYLLTGMRRTEVTQLRWSNLRFSDGLVITYREKGGEIVNRELREPSARAALIDYLTAAGRLETMQPDSPLWVSHDPVRLRPGAPLTSHAFVKNLKRYARQAGIGAIHLHQTRHTVARIVAEKGGLKAAQEQLGHKHETTTRVYVQRVGVRRDAYSDVLAGEFGVE